MLAIQIPANVHAQRQQMTEVFESLPPIWEICMGAAESLLQLGPIMAVVGISGVNQLMEDRSIFLSLSNKMGKNKETHTHFQTL